MLNNRAGGALADEASAGFNGVRRIAVAVLISFSLAAPSLARSGAVRDRGQPVVLVQSGRAADFDIAAQPLSSALTAFGRQSGLQVAVDTETISSMESAGVVGTMAVEEALRRLLAGTRLTFRFTSSSAVTVHGPGPNQDGALTLDPVTVEARGETAWGPVDGYVATRGATGTKTDTPLIETPQSISAITSGQLKAQGVESLAQALRYTPGVTGELFGVDNRGYGLQFRGFTDATDTTFYRDGLQLKGTAFAAFLPLDPYGAERLEVLRGPSSVLYGQGEPGGIINYVTKRPSDEAFGEVVLGGGSHDHHLAKVDVTGPLDEDRTLLFRVTGAGFDRDSQVDHVGHSRVFFAPSLTWRPDEDTTLTLLGHYQYDDTGWAIQFYPAAGTVQDNPNGEIPSHRFTGEPGFDDYDLTQYSAGYLFEHRFDDAVILRQSARYAHLDNEQEGIFGSGLRADLRTFERYSDLGESELDAFVVDTHGQVDVATGPLTHTLLLGVDYQHYDYSDFGAGGGASSIDIFDPVYGQPFGPLLPYQDTDFTQDQVGLYGQDQIRLDRLVLTLGGRHDWAMTDSADSVAGIESEQNHSAFTGRAGLTYLFDFGVAPYASYTESFLPVLGTDASGKPFAPETGQQFEIGVKYQPPGWNSFVALAGFDLTKQNVLTTDPADPVNQIQTGEVRSRGFELEGVADLNLGLVVRAAYTYLDTEITRSNDGNEGNTPYGVPRHRVSLWADYTIQDGPLADLGFGAGLRYIGPSFGDDANSFSVPGVTLADAAVHYDWASFRFAVNARNLFDEEYVASCFGSAAGCFYGERRKVLATVTYRW